MTNTNNRKYLLRSHEADTVLSIDVCELTHSHTAPSDRGTLIAVLLLQSFTHCHTASRWHRWNSAQTGGRVLLEQGSAHEGGMGASGLGNHRHSRPSPPDTFCVQRGERMKQTFWAVESHSELAFLFSVFLRCRSDIKPQRNRESERRDYSVSTCCERASSGAAAVPGSCFRASTAWVHENPSALDSALPERGAGMEVPHLPVPCGLFSRSQTRA